MVDILISKAKRRKATGAMFFADLDGFKKVNDTYGHECGNHVLATVSNRMKNTLRSSDCLARYAGDEFVIYLDDTGAGLTRNDCVNIASKLIHAIESPIPYEGHDINISLSIGISTFPDDGEDFGTLIKSADNAMYLAKKNKDQRYVFAGEDIYILN